MRHVDHAMATAGWLILVGGLSALVGIGVVIARLVR
jgi:hypothetical protein